MRIFRSTKKWVMVVPMVLALGACTGAGDKQKLGTLFGAAAGGLAGSQIGSGTGQLAATAVGVLIGAFAGSSVGESLDRADQLYASRAETHALENLPSGQTSGWSNPDSGHYGTVTPTQTYQRADGRYCREYQHTVYVGGQQQEAYGRACRQPDGSWEVIS